MLRRQQSQQIRAVWKRWNVTTWKLLQIRQQAQRDTLIYAVTKWVAVVDEAAATSCAEQHYLCALEKQIFCAWSSSWRLRRQVAKTVERVP